MGDVKRLQPEKSSRVLKNHPIYIDMTSDFLKGGSKFTPSLPV